ncbi:hypothetical protein X770_31800 [Mesorhizobium sp. LSJC269B00]|nr:hypothetical protein X770_31800 [Mesorhizobium sp. LSJC269B00]
MRREKRRLPGRAWVVTVAAQVPVIAQRGRVLAAAALAR